MNPNPATADDHNDKSIDGGRHDHNPDDRFLDLPAGCRRLRGRPGDGAGLHQAGRRCELR
jgi:hypothetical protein